MVSNNHDGIRCVWKTVKPAYDTELYPAAYPTTSSTECSLPRTGRATTRFASCPARKETTPSSSLTSTTDVRFSGTPRNQSSTAPHHWPPTSTAGANIFVEQHARCVPYGIRCIKSGLTDLQAGRLRDMLVAEAPQNILGRGSAVQTPNCWLSSHTELDLSLPALQS